MTRILHILAVFALNYFRVLVGEHPCYQKAVLRSFQTMRRSSSTPALICWPRMKPMGSHAPGANAIFHAAARQAGDEQRAAMVALPATASSLGPPSRPARPSVDRPAYFAKGFSITSLPSTGLRTTRRVPLATTRPRDRVCSLPCSSAAENIQSASGHGEGGETGGRRPRPIRRQTHLAPPPPPRRVPGSSAHRSP